MNEREAFKLKMRSLTLPVLQIFECQLEVIESQLEALKIKTPNLFQHSPMVLDMEGISEQDELTMNLPQLNEILRRYGIIPIGVQGVNAFYEEEAKNAGMPIFSVPKHDSHYKSFATNESKPVSLEQNSSKVGASKPTLMASSKVITKPVRSGQQIYAEGGDLIVIASVSPGAELLADGNIHVYGTLRGRALAGIQGNREARIFCQDLDADLVSIAGYYMISDVIERQKKKGLQQIFLENEKLKIHEL